MKEKLYIGIDIGGTKVNVLALKGLKKQQVGCLSFPTLDKQHLLEEKLAGLIGGIVSRYNSKPAGVGIGSAGVIDRVGGTVLRADNLPWLNGWKAVGFARRKFKVPAKIDNDARCFLRAEAAWGAARGKKNVIGVAIGTGIGGGLIINGEMIYGRTGAAAEFGRMIINVGNQQADDVKIWEDVAALRAFKKYGNRSKMVGLGIASLINALDPEMVVLGGGAVRSRRFNIAAVRKTARRYAISPQAKKTPIVVGQLGDAAQAIGAALLFAEE